MALTVPAAASTVRGTKSVPAVEDCGLGQPEVKPASLLIACADANALGNHLVWSKWGPSAAYATGTFTWNLCVPYCAASNKWGKAAANFALGKLVDTNRGWLYGLLVVHITGKVPSYVARAQTVSEAPRR